MVADWADLSYYVTTAIKHIGVWLADRHALVAEIALLAQVVVNVTHAIIGAVPSSVAGEAGEGIVGGAEGASEACSLSRGSSYGNVAFNSGPVVCQEVLTVGDEELETTVLRLY